MRGFRPKTGRHFGMSVAQIRSDAGIPAQNKNISEKRNVRLAAVGDLHCTKTSQEKLHALFQQISENADILLLCGDLVDYGQIEEAAVLAKELAPIKVPMLAVLGNHEYESNQQLEVRHVLGDAGVTILDGDAVEVLGIGFVGAKGLSHLVLFGFIYPGRTHLVPAWLLNELWQRQCREPENLADNDVTICRGTLLSRTQYLYDIENWGFLDARLHPPANMSPEDVERWTQKAMHKE